MYTDKWLRRQYVAFNKRYFNDLLPQKLDVRFADTGDEGWAAVTAFDPDSKEAFSILVDKGLRELGRYVKIVLLHEMCHVSIGYKEKHLHGPLWKKERKRLIDAGAFTQLI